MSTAAEIAAYLDAYLRTREIADYPGALNGLQADMRTPVRRIAAAVDFSRTTIERAIAQDANLLLVHHGMFWGGTRHLVGVAYERIRLLFAHDIGVYASHLPLDAHPECGNNVLLAAELGLVPGGGFAQHAGLSIGVQGVGDVPTAELALRAGRFAQAHGGHLVAPPIAADRRTRRWGICTGAGASADTIAEATAAGIDTLIVGEGPHYTAVDARDLGLVILYAGHYATETLGVRAIAARVSEQFGIPWEFIDAPTGL
jgi:dinuclear metal center YbgI/SA1388 family protein